MAPRKATKSGDEPAAVNISVPPSSRLPDSVRFGLLAITSLSLSSLLYSLTSGYLINGSELAAVSRSVSETWQVLAILGWKVAELGIGWFGEFDDVDIAALAILSHVPHLYFLTSFYDVSLQTASLSLLINVTAITLPTRLLRRRSAARADAQNKKVVQDPLVLLSTSLLAASTYAAVLYASTRTWLPLFLVRHFAGLRSLERAHASSLTETLPLLVAAMLPVGWATREFLFVPAVAAKGRQDDELLQQRGTRATPKKFDAATATLGETVRWNVWGFGLHSKVLVKRLGVLLVFQGLNVGVQTFVAVKGADVTGAVGWAALWVGAAVVNARVFGWVSDV